MTVLNIPREKRLYKPENTILVGPIPEPHEPKLNINSFQNPLVCELLKIWEGIDMSIN